MKPRTALTVALVAAGLAVGLVSVDLYYSLTARLESQDEDGTWRAVAESGEHRYEPYSMSACADPEMRLVVHNNVPFAQSIDVELAYWNHSAQQTEVVLRETWRLDRDEERAHAFTVPAAAFEAPEEQNGSGERRLIADERVRVHAQVGDQLFLSSCVRAEASS